MGAQAKQRETATRATNCENMQAALQTKEAELSEIMHSAPAQLERLQGRLATAARRREGLRARAAALDVEAEGTAKSSSAIKKYESEAAAALQALSQVKVELRQLQATLDSETIVSGEEAEKLGRLELKMTPSQPSRLRHKDLVSEPPPNLDASCDSKPSSRAGDDGPSWADVSAESAFRANANYRSFMSFRDERERLWEEERRWLQDLARR